MTTTFAAEIESRHRAGFGGVKVRLDDAGDERWALRELAGVFEQFALWDCVRGLRDVKNLRETAPTSGQKKLLDVLAAPAPPKFLVLLDPEPWLEDPRTARGLKNLLEINRAGGGFVVVLSHDPAPVAPLDLLDYPRPTPEQTRRHVAEILGQWGASVPDAAPRVLAGLSAAGQENALALAVDARGQVDLDVLRRRKEAEFDRLPHLSVIEPSKTFDDLAGVGGLRDWVRSRGRGFDEQSGLPTPRGVLLAGPPGTGKSRIAEAVAAEWQMPLVALDIGAVFGKYIGESEGRIDQALSLAERLAPCVLLVDEVERAFGSGTERDGGTSARVTGKFLSWLGAKTAPVFVIFTSNVPTTLPPAMIRKGRLDEIFFVGLPDTETRKRVFEIYLPPEVKVDVNAAVERTEGWSPAEIESAILDARFGSDNFSQALDAALSRTSLYEAMPESLDEMISWARLHGRVTT